MRRSPGKAWRGGLAILSMPAAWAACAGDANVYVAPPPLPPEIKTVLIAEERGAGALVLTALPSRRFSEEPFLTGVVGTLFIFGYQESLDEIGIVEGPLTMASASTCASRSLLPAPSLLELSSEAPEHGWVPVEGVPPRLEQVRFEVRCPCAGFGVERYSFGAHSTGYVLFDLPDDGVGVVTLDALLELSSDMTLARTVTVASAVSAYRAANDRLRISTKAGQVLERTEAGQLVPIASVAPTIYLAAIDGSPPGHADEALAADDRGEFFDLRGSTLTSIAYPPQPVRSNQLANVLWREPGHFVVSVRHASTLFDVVREDGQWVVKALDWTSLSQPVSKLGYAPGYGILIGTRATKVFHLPDGESTWIDLTPTLTSLSNLRSFLPFAGGLLVGAQGALFQHHPRSGYCPPLFFEDGAFVPHTMRLQRDGAVLVSGKIESSEETIVYRLTP